MAGRATQQAAESLIRPTSQKARATQSVVESAFPLVSYANVLATQQAAESVIYPSSQQARATQIVVESVFPSEAGYVYTHCIDLGDYTGDVRGEPASSDRAAWDVNAYPARHSDDLKDSAPTRHNPWPASSGQAPVSDGSKYVATDVATQAELDAHAGTPDAHHDLVSLAADADVLLGLTGQQLTLDAQTANTLLAGPTSGGAADPAFRGLVSDDLPEHDVVGAKHTITAAAMDLVGATAVNTLGLLTPSANPGAASVLLKTDASGYLQLVRLGIAMAPVYALDVTGTARISGGLVGLRCSYQSELTLDTDGAITVSDGTFYRLDTFENAAEDDLVTINGGTDGQIIVLCTIINTRDITVKNGTGNIVCGADFTLDRVQDRITLQYDDTLSVWLCLSAQSNAV